jgi:hypothetical protein
MEHNFTKYYISKMPPDKALTDRMSMPATGIASKPLFGLTSGSSINRKRMYVSSKVGCSRYYNGTEPLNLAWMLERRRKQRITQAHGLPLPPPLFLSAGGVCQAR